MKLVSFKIGNWTIEFRNRKNIQVAPVLDENDMSVDTLYIDVDGFYLHSKRRIMELNQNKITIIDTKK